MKTFFAAIFSSAIFAAVSAQLSIISPTSPLSGTKYKAGQEAIISWVNQKVPTISQIVLTRGPSTALQPIAVIARNVNAGEGKFVWKIPADIESASDYSLEFGNSPDLSFAGPFSIEGGSGSGSSSGFGSMEPAPASSNSPSSQAIPAAPPSTNNNPAPASPNLSGGAASPASASHSGATHLHPLAPVSFMIASGALLVASLVF